MVLNPRHHDRWSGAHLLQGCRRLTSGFSFRGSSEMRVSRGLINAAQGMPWQGGAARATGEQRVRGSELLTQVVASSSE